MFKVTCNPVIRTSFLPLFMDSSVNFLHGFIRKFISGSAFVCLRVLPVASQMTH